ncbi:MAG: hypothetical protein K8T20_12965 [Planctomycetes bacterium]|nr:hypothetical protein [Planctomycetota bacterium]
MSPARKKPAAKKSSPASGLLEEIRGRRETTTAQALGLLDLSASSDRESKLSLLSMAARHLADPKVCGRWIELAEAEKDVDLRRRMIAPLVSADPRRIPDPEAWVGLLIAALSVDATRDLAIGSLGRFITADPRAAKALTTAYAGEKSAARQRAILSALCTFDDPPPGIAKLLANAMDRVDADFKPALVSRLLRKDALDTKTLKALLSPTEPASVRRLVLDHVTDRAIAMEKELAEVVAKDPDPGCRLAAIQGLASQGASSDIARKALLDAIQQDASEEIRREALLAFEHSLELTPAVRKHLVDALPEVRSVGLLQTLLRLMVPYVAHDAAVRKALLDLLGRNTKGDLAAATCELLGRYASWDRALLEEFLKAYETETDDRVRVALLRTFSGAPGTDPRMTTIFLGALKSPEGAIQTWAAKGILHLPLNETNVPAFAAAAAALLDPDIDAGVRLELARKIVRIPSKSPELRAALKEAAQRGEGEMADLCRRAVDEAEAKSDKREVDWAQWLKQVDVERNAEGVFPDLFMHYDSNPEMARRVIRAALNPDVNLYQVYGYDVSALTLIQFLVSRNAVEDDISRYCIHFCLDKDSSYGSPDSYLVPLFSNLRFPTLKDDLWTIFDKRTEYGPVLMRELLIAAYGGLETLAAEFRRRIRAKETETALIPYLKFLAGNLAWEPAPALLDEIVKRFPTPEEKAFVELLDDAFQTLGREKPVKAPKPPGPGFADE